MACTCSGKMTGPCPEHGWPSPAATATLTGPGMDALRFTVCRSVDGEEIHGDGCSGNCGVGQVFSQYQAATAPAVCTCGICPVHGGGSL